MIFQCDEGALKHVLNFLRIRGTIITWNQPRNGPIEIEFSGNVDLTDFASKFPTVKIPGICKDCKKAPVNATYGSKCEDCWIKGTSSKGTRTGSLQRSSGKYMKVDEGKRHSVGFKQ